MFGRRSAVAVVAAVLVLMMGVGLLASPQPAFALSSGCSYLDSWGTRTGFASLYFPGANLNAGERVVFTFSNAANQLTVSLEVNGVEVASAPLAVGGAVTLEYTIPAPITNGTIFAKTSPLEGVTLGSSCGLAPTPPSPSIPEGFVLRTITCDTPLYTTANGTPVVGGAAVKAGQTWFFAPEEETPGWIEGFFGGWTNAWLPAACVQ